MKVKILNHSDLDQKVNGALARAPHAVAIKPTVRQMHKFVSGKLDFQRDAADWFYKMGSPGRSVWVTHRGSTYYFLYDFRGNQILMKQNSRAGSILEYFQANDPAAIICGKLSTYFW